MTTVDARLYDADLFGDPMTPVPTGVTTEKFLMVPFSILDARMGTWQERKKAWVRIGLKSEVGRSKYLAYAKSHSSMIARLGYQHKPSETISVTDGTSIFDPTLCECIYRWFTAEGDQIVDPFAGGSVRGIIAGCLDRPYWGCDLSWEQLAENRTQARKIKPNTMPTWVQGDALDRVPQAPAADLIFTCPPYGDLETYSDDPRDISGMEWHTFLATYKRIILRACARLKDDRFACVVVGDFRDKRTGFYRNFISETIAAFRDSGLELYNEGILVTAISNSCMIVARQFRLGRKFVKTHQNVLVFCKGDWRNAVAYCTRKEKVPDDESTDVFRSDRGSEGV